MKVKAEWEQDKEAKATDQEEMSQLTALGRWRDLRQPAELELHKQILLLAGRPNSRRRPTISLSFYVARPCSMTPVPLSLHCVLL